MPFPIAPFAWPVVGHQWPAYNIESNQAKGLVAWWPTIASAGSNVLRDLDRRRYDITLSGPTWTGSEFGQVLSFDGNNDYGSTSSTINFGSSIITVSFWLNWDAYANNDDLAMELTTNYNLNDGTFIINPNSSGTGFEVTIHDNDHRQERFTRPSAGIWHHYGFVFDNSTVTGNITVYVDGKEVTTNIGINNKTGSGNFKTDTLYFMSRAGAALFGAGKLGDTRIYSVAKTASEVAAMFELPTRWELHQIPRRIWMLAPTAVAVRQPRHGFVNFQGPGIL